MIKKQLTISKKIMVLEAALKRLKEGHVLIENIREDYRKGVAGYKGELSLDYYFNLLPPKDYLILHNLRLPNINGTSYFQIDILLLSPYFFLILEVKNISGTLTFDPFFDQVIWTSPEKEIALADPVRQVKNQRYQLIEWMKSKNIPQIPIESIVTLTNPNTIIKMNSNNRDYFEKIIRSTKIISKIEQLKKKYSKELLTSKELNKISNQLIKHHTPSEFNIFQHYSLQKSDLQTGVYCEKCSTFNMEYRRGKWVCPHCTLIDKEAHLAALKDYCLLFHPTITNQQLKEFLHLRNSHTAYYLLQTMNLRHIGNYKNRTYYLTPLKED